MDRNKAILVLQDELSEITLILEKARIVNKALCESNAYLEGELISINHSMKKAKSKNEAVYNLPSLLDTKDIGEALAFFNKSDVFTLIVSDYLNEAHKLLQKL